MWWRLVILMVIFSGCAQDPAWSPGCGAPEGADVSREPYDTGVALHTVHSEGVVEAWACNEGPDRFLLVREGECAGPWTWTFYPDGAHVPSASGPDGHYGQCSFQRLPAGTHVTHDFHFDGSGGEWRIRLHVHDRPVQIEDGGLGHVEVVYRI